VVRFVVDHQKRTKPKQKLSQLSQKWAWRALLLPATMPASGFGTWLRCA
jgi:hypothetical protein